MTIYDCTAVYFANASTTVDADSPEQAAELAQDKLYPTLCHQCASELDFDGGDPDGFRVSEAGSDKELLDTTSLTALRKYVIELEAKLFQAQTIVYQATKQRDVLHNLLAEAYEGPMNVEYHRQLVKEALYG